MLRMHNLCISCKMSGSNNGTVCGDPAESSESPPRAKALSSKPASAQLSVDSHPMTARPSLLERSLGSAVRKLRTTRNQSMQELAAASGISPSMISRIESGHASPSLATINALANALSVPASSLLGEKRRQTDVSFVKAGGGLSVERRGAGAGHKYQLLGHSPRAQVLLEPYLITLEDKSEHFELLMHEGIEFMYLLSGSLVYRVGDRTYTMTAGDSLCFDASAPHAPEKLITTPVKIVSIISSAQP